MRSYVGYIVNDKTGASPYFDEILFTNMRPAEYGIVSGALSQKTNCADQLTITLPKSNIMLNKIIPSRTAIRVEEDGKTIFVGAISERTTDFAGNTTIVAEDFITSLDRIIDKPQSGAQNIKSAITYIAAAYSRRGAPLTYTWPLEIGDVDVSGSVVLNPDNKYITLFEALKNALMDKTAFIRLRYGERTVYIDCLATMDFTSNQSIEFGKNVLDISDQINTSTIVTRVYPIGKDGLTIASLVGKAYLINQITENAYGRTDKQIEVDTDNVNTLKQYGQAYLTRYAALKNTITLTALDLSALDLSLDAFSIGDSVHVISPPQGIDADMPICEVVKDFVKPADSKVTLGTGADTITGIIGGA